MNEEDALLAAIRATLDDDMPRLVYADWLDERAESGDAVRAEFIRVQVAIARAIANEPAPPADTGPAFHRAFIAGFRNRTHCEGSALATIVGGECRCVLCLLNRERELYATSADWMVPTWPEAVDGVLIDRPEYEVRCGNGEFVGFLHRGGVTEMACFATEWIAHGDAILACHPVARVRLRTVPPLFQFGGWGEPCLYQFHGDPKGIQIDIRQLYDVAGGDTYRVRERKIVETMLKMRWPGITFDLPSKAP